MPKYPFNFILFNRRMFSPYINVLITILCANSDQNKYLSIATISDATQWETFLNQSSYIFHILWDKLLKTITCVYKPNWIAHWLLNREHLMSCVGFILSFSFSPGITGIFFVKAGWFYDMSNFTESRILYGALNEKRNCYLVVIVKQTSL